MNSSMMFEGLYFSLPTEENASRDVIKELEENRDVILDRLDKEKDLFLVWLSSLNKKTSIDIDTLNLLVSCWLAAKETKTTIQVYSN